MKVLFLEHVLHVAKAGEVKEVSDGYATNFLFPKKLAKTYTPELEKQLKLKKQKKEADRRVLLGGKQEMIDMLAGQVFELYLPTLGEKVLKSITPKEVADYISKKYHIPIQKKHIIFTEKNSSLKKIGNHEIYIDFGNNFATKAFVRISPQAS